MVVMSTLEERKARILRAVVRDYIRTAEPVGSGAIVRRYRLGVSPATVRHEMAVLEELGFLVQPHTSAGRIPTDRGYRYFVDTLPTRLPLPAILRRGIVDFFDDPFGDVDVALQGATQLLSRLTGHAAIAIPPRPADELVTHAELLVVGSSVLLLVVSDTGRVHKRALEFSEQPDGSLVHAVSGRLAEALPGRSYAEVRAMSRALAAEPGAGAPLLAAVADALEQLEDEPEPVFLGGVANIAGEEAFEHRETLRRLVETLEERTAVIRLLQVGRPIEGGPLLVRIGSENPLRALREASVVLARYGFGDRIVGTVAVIGPTRMEYPAVMSTARAVAGRLSDLVGQLSA